jgi:hypothetical protein
MIERVHLWGLSQRPRRRCPAQSLHAKGPSGWACSSLPRTWFFPTETKTVTARRLATNPLGSYGNMNTSACCCSQHYLVTDL